MTRSIYLMYKLVMLLVVIRSLSFFEPGNRRSSHDLPLLDNIGLMVCYDLRFPELALTLKSNKALIFLTAPAAFTYTTGQMHWQLITYKLGQWIANVMF